MPDSANSPSRERLTAPPGLGKTATDKLEKAISRTDGCVLRGAVDKEGRGKDWITNCDAQFEVYAILNDALDALLAA